MTWELLVELLRNEAKEVWLAVWLVIWTIEDLRFRKICLWQVVFVVSVGVIWQGIAGHLFTAEGIGGLMLGAGAVGFGLLTRDRFGMGDAMVILCLGLYLGGGKSLTVVMWGLLTASVVSLYLLWFRGKRKNYAIPFIPCLLVGNLLTWITL